MIQKFDERSPNRKIPSNFKQRDETRSKRQMKTETSLVEASHPVLLHYDKKDQKQMVNPHIVSKVSTTINQARKPSRVGTV